MDISHLKNKLIKWNLELNDFQEKQFVLYYKMLIKWNSVMNLTGITEPEEVMDKHYLDSLAMCQVYDFQVKKDCKVIDVGTGAGFPGIPLKIMFPDLQITLLDSLQKRINFLDAVVTTLELNNVELIHGRAEDFAKKIDYRERYDIATSRAVANLASLSEICVPFVKEKGVFISYKSEKAEEELKTAFHAIALLNGSIKEVRTFSLPDTDLFRTLLVISKHGSTSSKYPRKAGIPFKKPLY